MISKAKVKFIKSLQLKKYRNEEQSFVVEGAKSVAELLRSDFEVQWLAGTAVFLAAHQQLLAKRNIEVAETSASHLSLIGTLQTNDGAVAIASMRSNLPISVNDEYGLVLDDIRDPGNLGTIIRTADWYGIRKIIASEETTDFYSPKVIQATMGSFCRVHVFYTSLQQYLSKTVLPVYGAFLEGADVHHFKFSQSGLLVIGNEAQGISKSVEQKVTQKITIPRRGGAESLNASVATAIILDNIFR